MWFNWEKCLHCHNKVTIEYGLIKLVTLGGWGRWSEYKYMGERKEETNSFLSTVSQTKNLNMQNKHIFSMLRVNSINCKQYWEFIIKEREEWMRKLITFFPTYWLEY